MTLFITDKDKGIQKHQFGEALKRAVEDIKDPEFNKYSTGNDYLKSKANGDSEKHDKWPRTSDSADPGDPYGFRIKPKNVPYWTKPPISDAEKAIYCGLHIHSESNPLGLHSHIPGGELSGGHTHGPQNRFGAHHHKKEKIREMVSVDGVHAHAGANHPDGAHDHCPENFS